MDAFMKKIERLSEMAARRPNPLPLDAGGVLSRIRELEIEEEATQLPLMVYFGGAAAAAVVAIGVTVIASSAWSDMSNPFVAMSSLGDVVDVLL